MKKIAMNWKGKSIFSYSCLPSGRPAYRQTGSVLYTGTPRLLPQYKGLHMEYRPKKPLKYYFLSSVFVFLTIHFALLTAVSAVSAEPPRRIVSLAPSTTEMLYAIGLGDRIVGVTTFCDYPEDAQKKAKIGGMSNPSLEAVVSLKPDIVVMTTDGNPKVFAERLHALGIRTYIVRARRISELPQGIREMGSALDVTEKAESFARSIEASLDAYQGRAPLSPKKKILFIVWPKPLIVAGRGTVIDDAITFLGGINIAAEARSNYPKYSVEEILHQEPDLIFIGKGMGNIEKVSEGLLKRLKTVSAVEKKKVFYVSDLLYRLGPRVVAGIEELAELME
jgi:iron complex transport system substrate-binding protein